MTQARHWINRPADIPSDWPRVHARLRRRPLLPLASIPNPICSKFFFFFFFSPSSSKPNIYFDMILLSPINTCYDVCDLWICYVIVVFFLLRWDYWKWLCLGVSVLFVFAVSETVRTKLSCDFWRKLNYRERFCRDIILFGTWDFDCVQKQVNVRKVVHYRLGVVGEWER